LHRAGHSSAADRHRRSASAIDDASIAPSINRSRTFAGYRSAIPADPLTIAGTPRQIASCTPSPYAS
jgi:hypothetical protein